jgi:hypothetical protein
MPHEWHAVRQPDDVRIGAVRAVRRAPFVHRAGLDYQPEGSGASIEGACPCPRVDHIDREPWLGRLLVGLLAAKEGDDHVAGRAAAASRMCSSARVLCSRLPRLSLVLWFSRLPWFTRPLWLSRLSCRSRWAYRRRRSTGRSRLSDARRRCGRRLPGRLLGRVLR